MTGENVLILKGEGSDLSVSPLCVLQAGSAGHQTQQPVQGLASSSTPVHTALQYLQPGHSHPVAPYAAAPAPASAVNIQHTAGGASYTPPSLQQSQAAASLSASALPQHVAQGYQAPGQRAAAAAAASSLTFPLKVQQTNPAAQQQPLSASGYSAAAAATTMPVQQSAQSYSLASVATTMAATDQCHPAHAPNALQQAQAAANLPSQQPAQSSSTPALYSQQIPIQQEHQQPVLQSTQAYIQPQLQQEALHSIHQQLAPQHHQVHTPTLQKHSQANTQRQQSHDVSQSQAPAAELHPMQSYPDAAPQSYAPAPGQYLPGGASLMVTPQNLQPAPSQLHQAPHIAQQVSKQGYRSL